MLDTYAGRLVLDGAFFWTHPKPLICRRDVCENVLCAAAPGGFVLWFLLVSEETGRSHGA
jgi:hypothetical protein